MALHKMDRWEEILEARVPLATSIDSIDVDGSGIHSGSRKRKIDEVGTLDVHRHHLNDSSTQQGVGVSWLHHVSKAHEEDYEQLGISRASQKIIRGLMQKANLGLPHQSDITKELQGQNDEDSWNHLVDTPHQVQVQKKVFPIILNVLSQRHQQQDRENPVPIPTADLVQEISAQIQKVQTTIENSDNNESGTFSIIPLLPSSLDSMNTIYAALIFLASPISTLSPQSKHEKETPQQAASPATVTDPLNFFPPMPILEKNLPHLNSIFPVSFSMAISMSNLEQLDSYENKLNALESFFWSHTRTCSSSDVPSPSLASSSTNQEQSSINHKYTYIPRIRNIPRVGCNVKEESLLKSGELKMKKVTRKRKKAGAGTGTFTGASSSLDMPNTSANEYSTKTKADEQTEMVV